MCHCHHFCQITQNVNCLRDLESFDVARVSGMTRTYGFNANMYIYTCSHRNGLFHLSHDEGTCSSGVTREEFQPQEPEPLTEKFQLEKFEHLRNSSIRNLNP